MSAVSFGLNRANKADEAREVEKGVARCLADEDKFDDALACACCVAGFVSHATCASDALGLSVSLSFSLVILTNASASAADSLVCGSACFRRIRILLHQSRRKAGAAGAAR